MTPSGKAASVHDRLLAAARAGNGDFNQLLSRYALERFLFRLSGSRHGEKFLLKGAFLFFLWYEAPRRPTRDVDLLGLDVLDLEATISLFREVCEFPCDDGMVYRRESVSAAEIREDARYGGLRVELQGELGSARCKIQIDVGYGDAVTPDPAVVSFPTLLSDTPAPVLKAYPKETVIAEKLEAIVSLGMANSRMKDYFDLYSLFGDPGLDLESASRALRRTFERRGTPIPCGLPLGLSSEFAFDKTKATQWKAFLSKNKLAAPPLDRVVDFIAEQFEKILAPAPEEP